jgi:hypothetical protein
MIDWSSRSNTDILRTLSLALVAVCLGVATGCDTVEVRTAEEADTEAADEVEIRSDTFTRADIRFEPVSLSPGETFSVGLMDETREGDVTRIIHEGSEDGRYQLRAQFDPLNPASVTVRCRNVEENTQRTMATLEAPTQKSGDVSGTARTSREPTSYHYIQDGETTVVEVDYDTDTSTEEVVGGGVFQFPSADEPVTCTHVAFVLEDVSRTIRASGVRFDGREPTFRQKRFQQRQR